MRVKLVLVEGKPLGRTIPLPSTVFLIGRDRQCHLRPHSQLVSQLHCAIARKAGKVVVRDLRSANGTLVNGQPITEEVALKDGDTLRIGDLAFKVTIQQTDADQPVQIVDEREVGWLIATPSDSAVLEAGQQTQLVRETPFDGIGAPHLNGLGDLDGLGDRDAASGSKRVSAGQYLRDYLKKRR